MTTKSILYVCNNIFTKVTIKINYNKDNNGFIYFTHSPRWICSGYCKLILESRGKLPPTTDYLNTGCSFLDNFKKDLSTYNL